ncbi:MAG TPA: TlpA disulfide reductase family protein [Myxococcaceae bacterium]|nr:TlpA disulfide reductase family protein [Myxococcaceae bacterium]
MRNLVATSMLTLVLAGCAATPRIVHDKSGATSTLEDLKGRAVVLTFWVDYCQPCMAQMPVVLDSVAAHGDQVVFLPVFSREKPGHRLDGWLSTQPQWFRDQICWANDDFLRNYDRTLVPRTYVYGRNGRLVEQFDGMIDARRAPIFQASLLRALAAVK